MSYTHIRDVGRKSSTAKQQRKLPAVSTFVAALLVLLLAVSGQLRLSSRCHDYVMFIAGIRVDEPHANLQRNIEDDVGGVVIRHSRVVTTDH
jgi:hypothetical protein